MLNGHEYVAAAARQAGIGYTKEGNCFTQTGDLSGWRRSQTPCPNLGSWGV